MAVYKLGTPLNLYIDSIDSLSRTIPIMSEKVIVLFNDEVPRAEIEELVSELVLAGGEIKPDKDWFRQDDDVRILNGFAATIPIIFLDKFKSLENDGKILSIERDTKVTVQDEERAPLVSS